VRLGGKSVPIQGEPVVGDAEVVAVTDGEFAYDGPMFAGLTEHMGPSAWLRLGGVSVVVTTRRRQPIDQAFVRTLGIDCASLRYIAVKSAAHFRSGFEGIAGSIHNVDAAAIHSHDFTRLPYSRRTRPVFPVEIRPRQAPTGE
jgi:microcystin degradation protein MlrC